MRVSAREAMSDPTYSSKIDTQLFVHAGTTQRSVSQIKGDIRRFISTKFALCWHRFESAASRTKLRNIRGLKIFFTTMTTSSELAGRNPNRLHVRTVMLDRPLPDAQRGLLADEFVELRTNILQHSSMEQIDMMEAVSHPCVRECQTPVSSGLPGQEKGARCDDQGGPGAEGNRLQPRFGFSLIRNILLLFCHRRLAGVPLSISKSLLSHFLKV